MFTGNLVRKTGDRPRVRGVAAGSAVTVPEVSTWRRWYWRWAQRWERWQAERRLRGLQRRTRGKPRFQPGRIRIDGLEICYDDAHALLTEYRHIFVRRVYDFVAGGPRPLILDGGSHLGLSVLRFKRLAPGARVVAFEPDAKAVALLRENLRLNRVSDVEVVAAGLAGEAGKAPFVADGADGGRLVQEAYVPPAAREVPTVALRDYLDEPVEVLKLNIEGAEWEALAAARDRLHNVRHLVLEYHGFPSSGQHLHEILTLLDACGFRYVINDYDVETNPQLRPPFRIHEETVFWLVVAATRLWERTAGVPVVPDVVPHGVPAADEGMPAEQACRPTSRVFGLDRGQPIDRHYIEGFLRRHAEDVRGQVLEVGDSGYTRAFGGTRVTKSDVLSPVPLAQTTIVGDLTTGRNLPEAAFDCFILTQTLPFVREVRAAVAQARRVLKPGGVLLLTVPCISQVSRYDRERWGDYWRFTYQGLGELLVPVFGAANVTLQAYGNAKVAASFVDGRAAQELRAVDLAYVDEDYPVIIAARAVRAH